MKKIASLSCLLAILATAQAADTAYSPVMGGMTITVPAGQTRSVALPLLHDRVGTGAMVGRISAAGSNYIDVTGAGWTAGGLSTAANPYYLRIVSGAAAGRVMPVTTTANTDSRVFLNSDGIDLTTSGGPVNGDQYELVLADTLETFFGTTQMQGGADVSTADVVQIWNNTSWLIFYYNSTRGRWERSTDTAASPSRNTFALRPDRGIMITRRAATDLKLYVTGRVPATAPRYFHGRPNTTFLSTGLPADVTLGTLSLQTRAPGWVAGTSPGTAAIDADLIQVWNNTSWLIFYYDSSTGYWRRNTDIASSPSRNTFNIPAGRPILIRRLSTNGVAADGLITMPMPYTL